MVKAIVSVLAVAGLIALGRYAFEAGTEGMQIHDATAVASRWYSSKAPTQQQWASIRDDMRSLVSSGTDDPAAFELLALADTYLADASATSRQEYLSEAVVQFGKSLELRPMSAYVWANLAATQYRLGDTGKPFRTALVHAAELGPQEPEVQATVANFGLAVWNEVDAQTQAAIESSVAAGMRRQPRETLQIAERRGRLAVPCRHVAGSPRQTDTKWLQLCQSTEATP